MQDCNHEEADTRIVVHIQHALQQGMKTIEVQTVDTDVVVILVGVFYDLHAIQPLADIWIAFGVGKNYRILSVNAISSSLSCIIRLRHNFCIQGKGKEVRLASLAGI